MRQSLIVGNWKMNSSVEGSAKLVNGVVNLLQQVSPNPVAEVAICPPFPYLSQVGALSSASGVALGAQNICALEGVAGAYTGEVSAAMLVDLHCKYVIIGHSERRQYFAESDASVAEKLKLALQCGLSPIICIGESKEQRQQGLTSQILQKQLAATITLNHNLPWNNLVIAYEPLWAIGTGDTATPRQAQEVHAELRGWVRQKDPVLAESIRIIYGGSVKPDNASDLLQQVDIDGALVGGASLTDKNFVEIIQACKH